MPSKLLTSEMTAAFAARVVAGCNIGEAARKCGVAEQTAYSWLRLGKKDPDHQQYGPFRQAVLEAQGKTHKAVPHGRKLLLTTAKQQEICDRLAAGNTSQKDAAILSGISYAAYNSWREKGQEEDAEPHYREFYQATEMAMAKAKYSLVEKLLDHAGMLDNPEGTPSKISKKVRMGPDGKTVTEKHEVSEPALWRWRILQARHSDEFGPKHRVDAKVTAESSTDIKVILVGPEGDSEELDVEDEDDS